MNKDSNNETKTKFPIISLIAPVATALVVGGTAPWWVDFIKGESSNGKSPEENQILEGRETNDSINIQGSENTINDNSVIAQDRSVIQQSNGSGSNFSAGRDITVNEASDLPEIPEFKGEIGHYEASVPFTNFIFENVGNIVSLDAESFDDLSRQPETGFVIDYFHLWDNCFEALEPGEAPWYAKCTGTGFSIDRSDPSKDAIAEWFRAKITIKGYFSIKGCSGPHQGSMGCTLRPLSPEDIR